ncbi:AAA family ATPase [Halobacteria archaeon AArc-curdl1]|uniref:AAA family ATPase n=1 Tax=Natronosalvus hydrolyticus TaxID=2979988 RepID=A0AAP3E7M6_9EURY|nr:AAA family ATPase [Halobacteria archaeon AArc-curdl1]
MDLEERITRRLGVRGGSGVLIDRDALNPTVHQPEPIGRGSVLERLLDNLEPAFADSLPESFAVSGPAGSGTSAVITALFSALTRQLGTTARTIGTTTRTGAPDPTTWFVYVDGRRVTSAFGFYRAVLSTVSAEPVPASGVGTDALREQLTQQLARPDRRAVIAIDHHDEPETLTFDRVQALLEPVEEGTTTVPVGQQPPTDWHGSVVDVPAYRRHELVDILTARSSIGLAAGAIEHHELRSLAEWADGNAHDGLTALFSASLLASEADRDSISAADIRQAQADIPADSVHLDRVLALPETRQRVLLALLDLECVDDLLPIRELAAEIATDSSLTKGTVKRFLYELADKQILARVPLERPGSGRQPSTLDPRFPQRVFRALSPEATGSR